jgi:hypothetical protein
MPRRDLWVAGIAIGVGLAIIVVLVISGISPPQSDGESPQAAGQLIAVPTAPPPVPAENGAIFCHQALLSGPLIAHPRWGITVGGAPGEAPPVFWPNGYVARTAGDRLELLDEHGRVVARTGDVVSAGGGQASVNGLEGFLVCPFGIEFQPVGQTE